MPSRREEFEASKALYDEAMEHYEAAKAEFETLKKTIAETNRSGNRQTRATLAEEDELRKKLFAAADRLSRLHRRLQQLHLRAEPHACFDGVRLSLPQRNCRRHSRLARLKRTVRRERDHRDGYHLYRRWRREALQPYGGALGKAQTCRLSRP